MKKIKKNIIRIKEQELRNKLNLNKFYEEKNIFNEKKLKKLYFNDSNNSKNNELIDKKKQYWLRL